MRFELTLSLALGLAFWSSAAQAQHHGRLSAGAVVWRHNTDLLVERATDFNGSDDTAGERAKDWDVLGSGLGFRLNYEFPKLLTLYGEAGAAQATVRDRDVTDPSQDVSSRGLNEGGYYAIGARLGGDFTGKGNLFWSTGAAFNVVSTELQQDINRSWDFKENTTALDGKLGTWVQVVGIYGGLRFVQSAAELQETDRTNIPTEQLRTIELERDEAVDLLLGAQTRSGEMTGFVELGFLGSFRATTGLAYRF